MRPATPGGVAGARPRDLVTNLLALIRYQIPTKSRWMHPDDLVCAAPGADATGAAQSDPELGAGDRAGPAHIEIGRSKATATTWSACATTAPGFRTSCSTAGIRPFQSTEAGTGLGLAMVRRVAGTGRGDLAHERGAARRGARVCSSAVAMPDTLMVIEDEALLAPS